MSDARTADTFIEGCDTVVHLAGVNRGTSQDVRDGNIEAARQLTGACIRTGATPHVIYTNSIHSRADSPYGEGKSGGAAILAGWARDHGGTVTDLVVPHIFGAGWRPHYNSAVATLCHEIVHGRNLVLDDDTAVLELVPAQKVAGAIVAALMTPPAPGAIRRQRLAGTSITVGEVAEAFARLHQTYVADGVFPVLSDPVEQGLFVMVMSEVARGRPRVPLAVHADERGWLFETVRTLGGGQSFVSVTGPGVTRGNHVHLRKCERIVVLSGRAKIVLRRLFDTTPVELLVCGGQPVAVDVPPGYVHALTNAGADDLVTLFWTNEFFDAADADTFPERAE